MNQRYIVDGQSGDWVIIDTTTKQVVYRSGKKRNCDSWASIWNDGSTVGHDRMITGNQGRSADVGVGGDSL